MDRYRDDEPEEPDYDIARTPDVPSSPPRRTARVWAAVVVLGLVIAAAWFIVTRRSGPVPAQSEPAAASQPAAEQPVAPLGGTPAPVDVPPLDQSDAVVRELVRQLTSHPTVAAWLATSGLVRNSTVVIANVADGAAPARHLGVLRPAAKFGVVTQGGRLVIDPASYHRYDNIAGAAASIDPQGAARLYATLKPRIEEAYRDLGHPDTSVDRAVEQAIVRLLQVPIVNGPIGVRPGTKGVGYVYEDADLEALSAAQKQLLRMGPDNVRTVQEALRGIAGALGIPPDRLPAARQVTARR